MKYAYLLFVASLMCAGCCDNADKEGKDEKGTAETFVEGVTGINAIRAGENATETIKEAQDKHNRELEEALDN